MAIYNCKVVDYAHSTKISRYGRGIKYGYKKPEKNEQDSETSETGDNNNTAPYTRTPEEIQHSLTSSLNRTKNTIYDLAKSNDWEWFVTFTFDPKKYDSTDYDTVVALLKRFIDNVRHNQAPDIIYLIVPELHSDGEKFHFHGLFTRTGGLKLIPSGRLDKEGNDIYNVPAWKYGFSTASAIKDTIRASAYITKYITKECVQHTKYKKRYYASRNIKRPEVSLYNTETTALDIMATYEPDYIKTLAIPHAHNRVTHMEADD